MPRNLGSRTLSYVNTSIPSGSGASQPVKYVFQSGLSTGLRGDFGQTLITTTFNVDGAIFEANNFKPARANLFRGTALGYEGSFCSDNQIANLKNTGASIKRKKYSPQALSGRANAILYYATINGIKIGYRINLPTLPTSFSTSTGLVPATTNDIVIVGASFPKLGQAIYTDPQTGSKLTFACTPQAYSNLTGDWSRGKPPLTTSDDFKTLLGL